MAGKLKSINIKGFAIKHGEKVVFGLVAAFAAYVLFGADWLPFQHYPQEISNAVLQGEEALNNKPWPEEEQAPFAVSPEDSVGTLVSGMRTHVDPSPYSLVQNFAFDLYGTTSPISEPDYMPVRALRADAGRFVMYVNPEEEATEFLEDDAEVPSDEKEPMDDEADIPDEFKSRDTFRAQPGSLTGRGNGGRGKGKNSGDFGGGLSLGGGGLSFGGGGYEDEEEENYRGNSGSRSQSFGEGRGQRYVAVRGVVPLHEQITKIKKASNVSRSIAELLYDIMDFELERKKMLVDADDPGNGEWEPVDIEVSYEVLRDATSFDAEVVEGIVADSVITMPLPGLVMGRWGKNATHPDLENFTLTDEEIDLEMKIYEQLLKRHQEDIANAPEEPIAKGGFSGFMGANSRRLAGTIGRGGAGVRVVDDDDDDDDGPGGFGGLRRGGAARSYRQTVSPTEFLAEFEDIEEGEMKTKLQDYVKEKITASGQLLLFRYLDFDVEPGATYKYRVRLEVTNPNFGRKSSEADGLAHVVEGQTRKTEWSNVTDLAHVPRDADYFVRKIEKPRGTSLTSANFAVYKWDPEFGTTVADGSLKVELGQEVGGRTTTHVLNPAQSTFEIEDYFFQTGDILVDAVSDGTIRTNQHADLQMASGRNLGLSNQVLVLQGDGGLIVIDEVTRKDELEQRKKRLTLEQRLYEDIKDASVKDNQYTEGGRGGIFGDDDDDDDGRGSSGRRGNDDDRRRGRDRRRNPLQKNARMPDV